MTFNNDVWNRLQLMTGLNAPFGARCFLTQYLFPIMDRLMAS